MSFRGGSMYVRGGGVRRKRARKPKKPRKRKKRGGALIGSDPRTWAPKGSGFFRPFVAPGQFIARAIQPIRRLMPYRRAGRKRGSGMSFAGSGMSWSGAGIHGKRLIRRAGGGRRRI